MFVACLFEQRGELQYLETMLAAVSWSSRGDCEGFLRILSMVVSCGVSAGRKWSGCSLDG